MKFWKHKLWEKLRFFSFDFFKAEISQFLLSWLPGSYIYLDHFEIWILSFQKKMDRSFLNVQTCEKGEKKERAPMQFWFKEFIACCENDRAPTEEIVWHLKWKSEILCLRIKIHRIEWIVNYLISIHWTNQQLSSRSRAAILTLKFLERSFVDFWKIYSGQWQGHFQNE